jgi:uncharacterized protein YifE (UPF0438 family)
MGLLFYNGSSMAEKLTKEERLLIKRFGKFYKSLETGERLPTSEAQKHFVEVCMCNALPETEHEIAYAKFIGIYPKRESYKITNKDKSRWERNLQGLQEAFENNQIRSTPKSKRKPSRRFQSNKAKKKTVREKDNTTKKKISKNQSIQNLKCPEEIRNEILKKAKNRSSLKNYYIRRPKRGISEYEEGSPKPGWFTDDDWKKMRKQDYADMKKHHRE